jgi:hypothetical protein
VKEGGKSAFLDLNDVLKDLEQECDREEETKKVESTTQTKLTIKKTTTVVVSREIFKIDEVPKNDRRSMSVQKHDKEEEVKEEETKQVRKRPKTMARNQV